MCLVYMFSDYVCVVDVGMFELALRSSNGNDPVSSFGLLYKIAVYTWIFNVI